LNDKDLKDNQLLLIANYFTSTSVDEACEKTGIDRSTFYLWLKDEKFKDALHEKRKEITDYAINRLRGTITKATDVLIKLMDSDSEKARHLAARDLLGYAFKSIEIQEIEDRLSKIEQHLSGGQKL